MTDEVLDLVGVGVRRTHLNGVRQVEDHRILGGRAELLDHSVADRYRVVHLGAAETLGRVFKADIGVAFIFVRQALDQACAVNGDVDHALHVGLENDLSLQGRGGVVEVNDDVLCALDRLKGLEDQVFARLNQYLDRHVVGDVVLFDQFAADLILCFRRARKSDFDFLEAHVAERMEEFEFFFEIHRVDQCLVAVAQVNAAPDRRFGNGVVRPSPVGNVDLLERNVLLIRRFHKYNLQRYLQQKSPLQQPQLY